MNKINIAIVDDHPMVVVGLLGILKPFKHIKTTATYSNAAELLTGLHKEQPDVLLLDITLPGQSGKDILPEIVSTYPYIRVLVITSLDAPAMVNTMIRMGSKGFLLKGADTATLIEAIETVYRNEEYLDPALKEVLFKNLGSYKNQQPQPEAFKLSLREQEILRLIVKECTAKEIAEQLCIGIRTAEKHRYQLTQKLGVKNTAGLVKVAIQMGLIE